MNSVKNELFAFDLDLGKVIGVDEAGRGPLAGPVVAAAVILKNYSEELSKINDSKKISEKKREEIFQTLNQYFFIGVGEATPEEIDEINILNATFLAMNRALDSLKEQVGDFEEYLIIVDGNQKIRGCNHKQLPVVKGDSKSLSIAAASIVAKVTRDKKMLEEVSKYPEYGFEKHKGYGTKLHREKLLELGQCKIHRKTFLKKILP